MSALSDLHDWVQEEGLEDLAALPVEQIAELRLSPFQAATLRTLCTMLGADDVLAALASPDANRTLTHLLRPSQVLQFVEQLWDALEERATEAEAGDVDVMVGRARSTLTPPAARTLTVPSGSAPEVRRWAARHGVEERLADEAAPLKRIGSSYDQALEAEIAKRSTIGDLLEPFAAVAPRRSEPHWQATQRASHVQRLRGLALSYLHDAASVRAALLAKAERLADAGPPDDPSLAAALARVQAAREALARLVSERPLGSYRPDQIQVQHDPPTIAYSERVGFFHTAPQVRVTVPLDDPSQVKCTCAEGASGRCAHALTALSAAADVLRDPKGPDKKPLAAVLAVPPWQRFLRAFDGEVARRAALAEEGEARLVWRLEEHGGAFTVEARVQKLRKRGGFSTGEKAHIHALRDRFGLHLDAQDQRVAELVEAGSLDSGYGHNPQLLWRALEALVDHPRVVIAPADPVRVKRVALDVVVELDGGDAVLSLRIGGRRASAASLEPLRLGGRAVVIDAPRGEVLLCEGDARVRALVAAMVRGPARFPADAHDALLERLALLQGSVEVTLPEALAGEPIAADTRPVLRLALDEGERVSVEVKVRPIAGGPELVPGQGTEAVLATVDRRRVKALRDHAAEVARATALLDRVAPSRGPGWAFTLELEPALDLVGALEEVGDEAVVEWAEPDKRLAAARLVSQKQLRVRVTDRRDWFGVEGDVEVDGERAPLAELLAAVRAGRRYVRLGPGKFALIEADLRRRAEALDDLVHAGRHGIEVGLPAVAQLSELLDDAGELQAAARFRQLVRRIDAARTLDPELPEGLVATLRPYQIEGYKWLSRLAAWGVGACLADDMGLGKTLQTLALLLARMGRGPALVIAPTSVGSNWIDEAQRFAPGLRAMLYRGEGRAAWLETAGAGDVLVTSYALAVRDAELLSKTRFSTIVLDEAQAIKNALTRRAKAVRSLDAELWIALTGTPVENHLGELWALMRIVSPGLLGSWETFRDRFASPIERSGDKKRSAALARLVRPFLLRRTKAEVAPELPPRVEIARHVDLAPAERRLYDAARRDALESIAAASGDARFTLLAALTRLRRLACHPRLLDDRSAVPSSKLAALLEVVRELREEGHRALVFSQFTTHLALVREALDRASISYEYLDGQTPAEERARRVAAFQKGSAELFLISLKAGGTGLNLTAASYVIHLDPWWNPAVEDQATDRAHRIGQTRAVTVIRLIARGTIEEAVLSLHGEKRALAAGVFDEEGGAARLSTEELIDLVRAGATSGDADLEIEAEAEGDVIVDEASASSPPPSDDAPAPSAPPASSDSFSRRVIAHLARERGIADPTYHGTMRAYERMARRYGEYLVANGGAPPSEATIAAFLAAIESGSVPLPQSQRGLARTVMGHVRAFLRAQPPA